jgi:opacity protein-like surface antigen
MHRNVSRLLGPVAFSGALVVLSTVPARADGFITPFIGFNFGGDSANCPSLTVCDEKRRNFGVSIGAMGDAAGFEQDISFAKNFFGETPGEENSVFSAMSNLVLGPGVGPVRPYVVGGVGLIRSRVSSLTGSITNLSTGKNSFGYDLGGGITAMFGDHVGVRGDLRRFKTFQDVNLPFFASEKLKFWRGSVGLAFVF